MSEFSPEEIARRKKAVFDSMSARRRKHILEKIGYDNWDPFQEPKDPIDIRRDKTQRTTHMLVREFLDSRGNKACSQAYSRGVLEMALGLINNDERFLGMFEFAVWYQQLLHRQKHGE